MKLYPIKHTNGSKLWCGPAAIAAVTGYDTRSITQCIRDLTGKPRVMGLYPGALKKVLTALGVTHRQCYPSVGLNRSPTLAAWLDANQQVFSDRPVIINLTHHYMTVLGRMLIDNHTCKPVFLGSAPHRRCRVESWIIIDGLDSNLATWKAPVIPPKPPGYWAEVKERGALLKLAAQHGINIEDHIFPNEWFVYPPSALDSEALDPHYGDHFTCSASERAGRITDYLKLLGVPLPGPSYTTQHEHKERMERLSATRLEKSAP